MSNHYDTYEKGYTCDTMLVTEFSKLAITNK